MRIILIGFGIVGEAFAKIITDKSKELRKIFGFKPSIVSVVDISGAVVDPNGLNVEELQTSKIKCGSISLHSCFKPKLNSVEILENVDADVVVEVTPTNVVDGQPGLSHIMTALKKKRHVITTNKGPLAIALPALMELASYNRVQIRFSGTVGGGTPILDFGKKCLIGDRIISLRGILNGTTNYILTRMDEAEISMETALEEAKSKGYAEANPSYDLDGIDSACKLVIMANWLMNKCVTLKNVDVSGIKGVTIEKVKEAKNNGFAIKLLASISNEKLAVKTQLVPQHHPLCVGGTLNAVTFEAEYAGELTIVGKGAGGIETAGAILRDLIEIRREITAL